MERHGLGPPLGTVTAVAAGGPSPMAFLAGVIGHATWQLKAHNSGTTFRTTHLRGTPCFASP